MTHSGSGEATGIVVPVDLEIPSVGGNTSGCEAADFAGFPAGAIALVQRSSCAFRVKALNAAAAGASAVIIMNEGNTPAREVTLAGDVGAPSPNVPVVATSYAIGVELAAMTQPVVHIKVTASSAPITSSNVIAETADGDANNVVLVGASLDGRFGPAINATSGAAALLEIARAYAAQERSSRNHLRFVWFGAHPEGFAGASYYVSQLPAGERAKIRAVIEIGPIGSPNFGRVVFDGSQAGALLSLPPDPTADGASGTIEALFSDYFASSQLAVNVTAWQTNARPFREAGIPVGGIMTGTSETKTAQQASVFGGTAGVQFDPCFSQACDGLSNLSNAALDQMSDAAAHVVLILSRRNFAQEPLLQN
jgi:Zn-dependent M28 family amino/carboxypeptidase